MSKSGTTVAEKTPPPRAHLAEKALSEVYAQLRYRDTSLLIWQQQQLETVPPVNYLSRSRSAWYSRYGNQPVVVRDKSTLEDGESPRENGRSSICLIM